MKLFSKKKRRKTRIKRASRRRPIPWAAMAKPVGFVLGWALVIASPVIAGIWSINRLERYVLSLPDNATPPRIQWLDIPEGVQPELTEAIAPFLRDSWTEPALCRSIAGALAKSPWVRRVKAVRRVADGSIEIGCDYRMPVALVRQMRDYLLVASDRVRLPGLYGFDPALVTIEGAAESPPEPGRVWPGDDLVASMRIIDMIHREPYYDQVYSIDISNFRGRLDKRRPHVILTTAGGVNRIVWGSAPGEEVEENSVVQKLALLRANFERTGRIDAGHSYIDISIAPDGFIRVDPAFAAVHEAGGG